MSGAESWEPPGKNCGACGCRECDGFMELVHAGRLALSACPYYGTGSGSADHPAPESSGCPVDIFGGAPDFILHPFPGEISAHKIILPFRPDMVERMNIVPGDILTGRPAGAGCPVQHVLKVLSVSMVSGLITCHVVGPACSRGAEVKDLEAYHMIGFEGIAEMVNHPPEFGKRMRFLPGFCMMNLNHTGVVNLVALTRDGLRVRVEDIRLL